MNVARIALKVGTVGLLSLSPCGYWRDANKSLLAYRGSPQPEEHFFRWNSNWDKRDPKGYVDPPSSDSAQEMRQYNDKIKAMTPTANRHIVMVRHGQYLESAKLDKDRILTNLGRTQADITGQRLKQLGLPYRNITVSTMSRAQETARIIQAHTPKLDLVYDPCLSEGAPAVPDPTSGNWKPTPDQFFQDGARIENAFRKYFHRAEPDQTEDSYEVIVCHSNVIRYFVCRALQFPLEGWIRVSVANCSLTLLTIHPDGTVVMEMMGDHGHIPPESVTFH